MARRTKNLKLKNIFTRAYKKYKKSKKYKKEKRRKKKKTKKIKIHRQCLNLKSN